jgi:hypothetical protein
VRQIEREPLVIPRPGSPFVVVAVCRRDRDDALRQAGPGRAADAGTAGTRRLPPLRFGDVPDAFVPAVDPRDRPVGERAVLGGADRQHVDATPSGGLRQIAGETDDPARHTRAPSFVLPRAGMPVSAQGKDA